MAYRYNWEILGVMNFVLRVLFSFQGGRICWELIFLNLYVLKLFILSSLMEVN